jgi:hypothetical protein
MGKLHSDFNGSTYEVLPIDNIFIPPYQRDLLDRWAEDLSTNWNSRLFRPLTVNRRQDGRYACIDGQHTLDGAMRRGHKTIPAIVYTGLSEEEEAGLFSDLNTQRRKPEAFDIWVADFAARRPWAVELHDMATAYDLRLGKGGNDPRALRAIGALRELIQKGHGDIVDDALDILTSTYDPDGPYNKSRMERALIVGMADLIQRARMFDVYDKDTFKRKLGRASYRSLGASRPVTPDGFQSYIGDLISSGKLVVSAMNSLGSGGQTRIYGKAFAFAILGKELTQKVYGG